nr:hypothetical protein [Tanacetum cinerariifolium]
MPSLNSILRAFVSLGHDLGVGLADMLYSILPRSASTSFVSPVFVATPRISSNLFDKVKIFSRDGIKDAASQDVKKDVSSLRYIALLNWFHKAHLESSTSNAQNACNADAPESSGNSNPTATSTNLPTDHMETLTVESIISTVSSPVPTACLDDSPKPSTSFVPEKLVEDVPATTIGT